MVAHVDEFGVQTTYAYDALGRRIAKILDATGTPLTTRYLLDGWQEIEERDGTGATVATYVFGNYVDEVLQMLRDVDGNGTPELYYYHADDLYNVMAVSDAAGQLVERYEYGDYGQPLDPSSLSDFVASSVGNPFLFTGRRYDVETGLYYYRTRCLDPAAGRFTSRDVLGIWGDPSSTGNTQAFSASSPFSRLDPFGTQAECPESQADMEKLVKQCTFCRDVGNKNIPGSQSYRETSGAGNPSRHCGYRGGQLGGKWADHVDAHNPAKGKDKDGNCIYSWWWTFWHFILDSIPDYVGEFVGTKDPYEWQKHRQQTPPPAPPPPKSGSSGKSGMR
jgi:RHS repeat-associated protein